MTDYTEMTTDQIASDVHAIRYIKPEAPFVHKFLRWHSIVEAESVEEVMDRLDELLRNVTGITYEKSFCKFNVRVKNYRGMQHCEIIIYCNEGEHKKSMQTASDNDGKPQFVIEYYDTSRYFTELFRYMIDNYSADTIRPFSEADLNYGLYSFYSWEEVEDEPDVERDREQRFEEEQEQDRLFEEYRNKMSQVDK
jgi:hypothetical protein